MIVREPIFKQEPKSFIGKCGRYVLDVIAEVEKASVICIGAFASMRGLVHHRERKEVV